MPANRKRFSAESTGRAAGCYQAGCLSQQVVPLPQWRSHLGSKWELKLGFASIFILNEIKERLSKKYEDLGLFLPPYWSVNRYWFLFQHPWSRSCDPQTQVILHQLWPKWCRPEWSGGMKHWQVETKASDGTGSQQTDGAVGLWGAGDGLATPGTHKSDVHPQLESTESLLTPPGDVHCWRRHH